MDNRMLDYVWAISGCCRLYFTSTLYLQVRQDYIQGHLNSMSPDYMYWMGGIDMARKAQDEGTDFKGLV